MGDVLPRGVDFRSRVAEEPFDLSVGGSSARTQQRGDRQFQVLIDAT